jgi:uncharacterized membrane protein
MGHFERAIEITAPAEQVFDLLIDLDRLPQWATIVVRTEEAPQRPLRAGDTFRQRIHVARRKLDTEWRVLEIERPRHVLYEATGPGESCLRMRQTVEVTPMGSQVALDIDYRLPGGSLVQALDRILFERQNEHEAERSLQNLKRLVERESA